MPSRDKSVCMTCSGTAQIMSTSEFIDCVCPNTNRIVEDYTGMTKTCSQCGNSAWQGRKVDATKLAPVYECKYCPLEDGFAYNSALEPWECVCQLSTTTNSNGICYNNTLLKSVNPPDSNINYEFSENGGTLTRFPFSSGTMQYLYYDSALGCQQ